MYSNGGAKKMKNKIHTNGKSYHFQDSPLFKLRTKKRLEKILYSSIANIKLLSHDKNYLAFDNKKNLGKPRKIQTPIGNLDTLHSRIASLLSRIETPDYLHSGKKGRSNVTNAKDHIGFYKVLSTDIQSFFPSTSSSMIFSFFYTVMKCSADVSDILAKVCTFKHHLPTGSRISMPLAFFSNIRMFDELQRFAKNLDVKMTVYVDDLTFSGGNVNRLFSSCVKNIIVKHGHTMHLGKTKIYAKNHKKIITGVVVTNDKLQVRNSQHHLLSSEIEQWKSIRDNPLAINTSITPRLIGRLYSMGVIDPKFKSKAMTVKKHTHT